MATHQNIAQWYGKTLVDPDGENIGSSKTCTSS